MRGGIFASPITALARLSFPDAILSPMMQQSGFTNFLLEKSTSHDAAIGTARPTAAASTSRCKLPSKRRHWLFAFSLVLLLSPPPSHHATLADKRAMLLLLALHHILSNRRKANNGGQQQQCQQPKKGRWQQRRAALPVAAFLLVAVSGTALCILRYGPLYDLPPSATTNGMNHQGYYHNYNYYGNLLLTNFGASASRIAGEEYYRGVVEERHSDDDIAVSSSSSSSSLPEERRRRGSKQQEVPGTADWELYHLGRRRQQQHEVSSQREKHGERSQPEERTMSASFLSMSAFIREAVADFVWGDSVGYAFVGDNDNNKRHHAMLRTRSSIASKTTSGRGGS